MLLTGSADVLVLADQFSVPTIAAWSGEPFEMVDVHVLQLIAELPRTARECVLPPGLHPTEPAALSIQAWRVGDSAIGSFTFCHTRLSCRSGVRARGMTTAAVASTTAAAMLLRERFGFPSHVGHVRLDSSYDRCDVTVLLDDTPVLVMNNLDPQPLDANDVQYTSTLNLAHTPNGLRLVQVDADHHTQRLERLTARLTTFDARAWGDSRIDPYFIVTTTLARAETVTLAPVRFVCRADISAFEGTESISR